LYLIFCAKNSINSLGEKMGEIVKICREYYLKAILCVTGVFIIGFLMGNMPGAGTVIMALFTGPLFAFFRVKILVWGKKLEIITW